MSMLSAAIAQMKFSRSYTMGIVETIDKSQWLRMPSEGVTHVGWQVAHLAMADYRLGMERIRGARPADEQLISTDFLTKYGKGSIPDPDPANNLTPDEILAVVDRVRHQMLSELAELPEDELDRPPLKEHPLFTTKLGSLQWCASHELIHAGQLALLRRLFGQDPLR